MAFKTFTAGSVLTASDVNTYLMKQAVIVCTSGTRPSSPINGMTIHETDTGDTLTYNGSSWVVRIRNTLYAYRTTDLTRASNTTATDDTQLTIATAAGRFYDFFSVLIYSADAAVDIKMGWMHTGTGARCVHSINAADFSGAQLVGSTAGLNNPAFVLGGFGAGANSSAVSRGLLYTGSTSGTFSLSWAQSGSSATGAVMRTDSYFVLRPLA